MPAVRPVVCALRLPKTMQFRTSCCTEYRRRASSGAASKYHKRFFCWLRLNRSVPNTRHEEYKTIGVRSKQPNRHATLRLYICCADVTFAYSSSTVHSGTDECTLHVPFRRFGWSGFRRSSGGILQTSLAARPPSICVKLLVRREKHMAALLATRGSPRHFQPRKCNRWYS